MKLDRECHREYKKSSRQIYLWSNGNFYLAFEWSAWLCVRYILPTFRVVRKHIKNVNADILYIGFPKSSLDKYTPEGSEVEVFGKTNVIFTLPENLVAPDAAKTLKDCFQDWRVSVLINEKTNKGKDYIPLEGDKTPRSAPITSVLQQLLEFSIENHSPTECKFFLAELKTDVIKALFEQSEI